MDALKIKTLEEDNLFLRGQVQLLTARNNQLEARISQLTELIHSSRTGSLQATELEPTYHSASGEDADSDFPKEPIEVGAETPTPPATASTNQFGSTITNRDSRDGRDGKDGKDMKSQNAFKFPTVDTERASALTSHPHPQFDPPTPRPTPIRARASSGMPNASGLVIRIPTPVPVSAVSGAFGGRGRSKTIAAPLSRYPSNISINHPVILQRIFFFATNTDLPSQDPFLQDSTTSSWNQSVKAIKAFCRVSKGWHTTAVPLLYTRIRLRRIPQLSVLVSSLEGSMQYKHPWIGKPFGAYTTSLDLSFYIPPEWNNLYADDVRRLIACVPNLQTYRSRPMLPILGPRPVPTAIILSLADTRNELLSELEFSEQEGPQMPDLIRLLQSCTYLEKLTLGKYVFDGGLSSNTPALRLPSLRVLEINVTNRLTPGSFASLPSPHLMAEAAKWDLPHLETLTLVLYDEIKMPFRELQPFLNIHGHKLRSLTLKDANPLMRTTPLVISGILSRCPELKEIAVVGSSTAPLQLARPHLCLERIRFLGTAPGSTKDMDLGGGVGGMPDMSQLGHLLALSVENLEGRSKFPKLREVVIRGEEGIDGHGLRAMWQTAVGPNIAVTCVGQDGMAYLPLFDHIPNNMGIPVDSLAPPATAISLTTPTLKDPMPGYQGDEDEDDEEDGEWLPDEEDEPNHTGNPNPNGDGNGSDEEDEDAWLASVEDERSDDETVRDSRSGRGRDDDQIDHTTALLIFQNCQDLVGKKLRHSFPVFPTFPLLSGAAEGGNGERVRERNGSGPIPGTRPMESPAGPNIIGTPITPTPPSVRAFTQSIGPGVGSGHVRVHASERESTRDRAPGYSHIRGLSGSHAHGTQSGHTGPVGHTGSVHAGHSVHGGHGASASVSGSRHGSSTTRVASMSIDPRRASMDMALQSNANKMW